MQMLRTDSKIVRFQTYKPNKECGITETIQYAH